MQIYSEHLIPDLSQAKRVLCVQPHYDDNDIGAGGTLALLHDQGAEIIYLTVTDDLVGVLDTQLSDELASRQLREEQLAAAAIIGINHHAWLGCPDAGNYDYYEMRREIIRHIRQFLPDFLFTCDPWLAYEAHRDHIQTGLAVAEASYLHSMTRFQSDLQVDSKYIPYSISGVVFYFTNAPNAVVDISTVKARKHRALDAYRAQFTPFDLAGLHHQVEAAEWASAQHKPFQFGEALKILRPDQLHMNTNTWKS